MLSSVPGRGLSKILRYYNDTDVAFSCLEEGLLLGVKKLYPRRNIDTVTRSARAPITRMGDPNVSESLG